MLKRYFIISLVLLAGFSIPACAEDVKTGIKGPVIITSDTLSADNKAHTALFEKNVVAKTDGMTLTADKMLVFYNPETGDVTKIDATGSVKLHKDNRLITAEQAVFFAAEQKVVFTGSPKAMEGENVITGTSMTYFIADDRSFVENSRVILKTAKEKAPR